VIARFRCTSSLAHVHTSEWGRVCAEHPAIAELTLAENRGKACAVLSGMTRARGALRLRADADSVTPIAEVKRLEAAAIQGGADLAVAPAPVRKAPWCGGRAFTGELLLLAQQRGYRIAEVPVNAADVPGSEIAVPTARSRKARRDSCHVVASCFFLSLGRGEAETPDKGLSSPNTLRNRVNSNAV
jgi:hypothetical protein